MIGRCVARLRVGQYDGTMLHASTREIQHQGEITYVMAHVECVVSETVFNM